MNESYVIFLLMVYLIGREVFFLYSTNKLINKLMSHNFRDYQQSLQSGKAQSIINNPPKEFDDIPEDLEILQGIGIL